MNKNKIFITIWLITCLLIWIFAYSSYLKIQKKEKEIAQKLAEEAEINRKLSDLEIKPVIVEEKTEISTWSNIEASEEKDNTKKTLQDTLKNESISILTFTNVKQCDDLKYLKEKCKNKFLYSLAIESNNLSYCDKLLTQDEINSCNDEINYNKNNCTDISNAYLKEKCINNNKVLQESKKVTEILSSNNTNASLCTTLSNYSDKESCLKKVILARKDLSLCNSVFTDKTEQEKCVKNISYDYNRNIINEAYVKKDLSLCDKLTTSELKTQCKSMTF